MPDRPVTNFRRDRLTIPAQELLPSRPWRRVNYQSRPTANTLNPVRRLRPLALFCEPAGARRASLGASFRTDSSGLLVVDELTKVLAIFIPLLLLTLWVFNHPMMRPKNLDSTATFASEPVAPGFAEYSGVSLRRYGSVPRRVLQQRKQGSRTSLSFLRTGGGGLRLFVEPCRVSGVRRGIQKRETNECYHEPFVKPPRCLFHLKIPCFQAQSCSFFPIHHQV